jgi:hypothetical protein
LHYEQVIVNLGHTGHVAHDRFRPIPDFLRGHFAAERDNVSF